MKISAFFSPSLRFQFFLVCTYSVIILAFGTLIQYRLIFAVSNDIRLAAGEHQAKMFAKKLERPDFQAKSIKDLGQQDRGKILSILNTFSSDNGYIFVFDGYNYLKPDGLATIDLAKYSDEFYEFRSNRFTQDSDSGQRLLFKRYPLSTSSLYMVHVFNPNVNILQSGVQKNMPKLLAYYFFASALLLVGLFIFYVSCVYWPLKFISLSCREILISLQNNNPLDFKIAHPTLPLPRNYQQLNNRVSSIIKKIVNFRTKQLILMRGVSHEINKPLMLARHSLRLGLQQRISPHQALSKADEITKSAQTIISSLAMLNNLSFRNSLGSKKIIRINDFAERFISEIPFDVSSHFLRSHVDRNALKTSFYVEEDLLVQSLRILIDNSIKYSSERSTIQLIYSLKSVDQIQILVIDNGVGIPRSEWSSVFQPFVRGSSSSSLLFKSSGSGIGLSLAKILIEDELDGNINIVTPLQHSGTWIQILIPVFQASQSNQLTLDN